MAGVDVAADHGTALEEAGFTVIRVTLYQAREVTSLPDSARAALQARALDVATFFSSRGSRVFGRLVEAAGLADALRGVTAVAISPAAAAALAALAFKRVLAAARPPPPALADQIRRPAQTHRKRT